MDIDSIAESYQIEINHYPPIHGGDEDSSILLKGHNQDYVLTFGDKRT